MSGPWAEALKEGGRQRKGFLTLNRKGGCSQLFSFSTAHRGMRPEAADWGRTYIRGKGV